MRFIIIFLVPSIIIMLIAGMLNKLIERSLTKKRYKLTKGSSLLLTIVTVFLLAVFFGKEVIYKFL